MRMFVALAVFEGCPRAWLNSPDALRGALRDAVAAGAFTSLAEVVVPFSPQGVTACAVVSESHLALHSWPEEGRLFVDVASCGSPDNARRAVEAIARALPEGRRVILDERVLEAPEAGAG